MESKRIFPKPVTDESPKKSPFRKEVAVAVKPAPAKKAAKTVEPNAAAAPAPTTQAETGNEGEA